MLPSPVRPTASTRLQRITPSTQETARANGPTDRFTPSEPGADLIPMLQNAGTFSGRRWYFFKHKLTPQEAIQRVAAGHTVTFTQSHQETRIGNLTDMRRVARLDGDSNPFSLSPAEQSVQVLARGFHEGDGLFDEDMNHLSASEAYRRLDQGTEITARIRDNNTSLSSLKRAETLSRKSLSDAHVADHYDVRDPLRVAVVHKARKTSVEAVDRLAFRYPWPSSDFDDALGTDGSHETLQATASGKAVGHVILQFDDPEPRTATISDVAVLPLAQGKKVGEQLLIEAVEDVRKRGLSSAYLEVDVTNARAHSLYQKIGFEDVKMLPNYYADEGHDGTLMQFKNLQSPQAAQHIASVREDVEQKLRAVRSNTLMVSHPIKKS